MFKKIKQSNLFLFLLIMTVTLGLSLSLQSVFADYLFSSQPKGISVGNKDVILGSGENLLWSVASSTSIGNFILFQDVNKNNYNDPNDDIYTNKLGVDTSGNVSAAGDVCSFSASEGKKCLSDFAAFSEADTLQTVTLRGAVTNKAITINNNLTISGTVDGYDISNFGQYFIDSAGNSEQVWKSAGSGKGVWGTDNVLTEANVESYIANDINTGYIPYDNGSKLISSGLYYTSNRLGIANSAPGYPLHIQDDNSTGIINIDNEGEYGEYVWSGVRFERDNAEKWFIGMNDSDNVLRFSMSGILDPIPMYIDVLGKVHIGTLLLGNLKDGDDSNFFDGGCADNQHLTSISDNGAISCGADSGDISAVSAGTGLTGGGVSGSVTLNANTTYLQRRVSGTCAAGNSIRVINEDGTVTCEASAAEIDGVIGNEVVGAANATLARSGAGTSGDPYKLALNLGNVNTWTAKQTFSSGLTVSGGTLNLPNNSITDAMVADTLTASNYVPLAGGVNITGGLNIAGYVGIGITGPNKQLHIKTAAGSNAEIDIQSGANNHWGIYHDETTDDLRFWNAGATGEKNVLTLKNTGNVGIGTTAPGNARLKVAGTLEVAQADGLNALYLGDSVNGNYWQIGLLSTSGHLYFHDGTDYRATFAKGGNVGIGTKEPGAILNVYEPDESTTLTNFTQALTNAGILITTNYTNANYTPGIFWNTSNDNPTKPKAGIWLFENSNGTDMYFGTSNDYENGITNNGLVLDQIGNVGIGTKAPTAYLHLKAGTAAANTAPLKLTSGTNLTAPEAGAIEFDGTNLYYTNSALTRQTLATSAQTGANTTLSNLTSVAVNTSLISDTDSTDDLGSTTKYWANTYTDQLYTTGKVGIGTVSPEGLLEIQGTESADAAFYLDADDGDDNGDTWIIKSQTADNDLTFTNHTSELLRITDSGNVGIGTNSPGYKLSVAGTGTVPIVNIWNNSGTNQWTGMRFARDGTGDGNEEWFIGMNVSNEYLRIRRDNNSDALVINGSGEVGIGTTPYSQLSVSGGGSFGSAYATSAQADGNVAISGNVGIGTKAPLMKLNTVGGIMNTGSATVTSFAGTVSSSGTTITFSNAADAILAGYDATATNQVIGTTIIAGGQTRYIASWTNSTTCEVSTAPSPVWSATAITSAQKPVYLAKLNSNAIGMVVNSAGNVGIGTTAPGAKLHVEGDAIVSGIIIGKGSGSIVSNIAIGAGVLGSNTTGYNNTALGNNALLSNTTGHHNIAFGDGALLYNTTGYHNTAFGDGALLYNTTGFYNTAVGQNAGCQVNGAENQTSSNSVFLGHGTTAFLAGDTNEIVIGYGATGAGSNSAVLGNDSITKTILKGKIGIGMTAPTAYLHLKAGTAAANTAPLKLTSGTNLTAPEAGAIEFDGTNLYYTNSALTRQTLATSAQTGANTTLSNLTSVAVNTSLISDTDSTDDLGSTTKYWANTYTDQLYTTGKVGIGTVSPEGLLEIQGTESADAAFYLDADDGDDNGDTWIIKSQTADNDLTFTNHTSELLRITDSGNVGIGTTEPNKLLHIKTASGNAEIDIQSVSGAGLHWGIYHDRTTDDLRFWKDAADRVTFTDDGKVGIGTTEPTSQLFISKRNSNAATEFSIENSYLASGSIDEETKITSYFGGYEASSILTGKEEDFVNGTEMSSYLAFLTREDGNMTEAMRINKNGNVGIGTANPLTKLNVVDNVNGFATIIKNTDFTGAGLLVEVPDNNSSALLQLQNNTKTVMRVGANGKIGIGMTAPSVELDITGSIEYTGTITDVSDERLKENIHPIEGALKKVQAINGVYFNMKETPREIEIGVIAQEVQKVLPEAVKIIDEENGYLGVNYTGLIPVLIEAVKIQQTQISDLETRLKKLEEK